MAAIKADSLACLMKSALASLLYYSGITFLWWRLTQRGKAVVLMYHRVLSKEEMERTFSHEGIVVERGVFRKQVQFLRRHGRLLGPEGFDRHLDGGLPFAGGSCLITFDDGWEDNYRNAFPILREEKAPAVVFLPAGLIGTRETFWREEMGALLFAASRRREGAEGAALDDLGLGFTRDMGDREARVRVREWVDDRKKTGRGDKDAILSRLRAEGGTEDPGSGVDHFLDWDQVREMAAAGVSFGAHGLSHAILTEMGPDEAAAEIEGSIKLLKEKVTPATGWFSYPNGDWDGEVRDLVGRRCRTAFGTERGPVSPGDDRLALRRVNIHQDMTRSVPLFAARLAGIF